MRVNSNIIMKIEFEPFRETLKSKIIRTEACSDFNLFVLAENYTEVTEDAFGVGRERLTTLTGER